MKHEYQVLTIGKHTLNIRYWTRKEEFIYSKSIENGDDKIETIIKLIQTCVKEDIVKQLSKVEFYQLFNHIRIDSKGDELHLTFKCDNDKIEIKKEEQIKYKKCSLYDKPQLSVFNLVDSFKIVDNFKEKIIIDDYTIFLKRVPMIEDLKLSKDDYYYQLFLRSVESVSYKGELHNINSYDDAIDYFDNLRSKDAKNIVLSFINILPEISINKIDKCKMCNKEYNIIIKEDNLDFFL